MASWCFQLIPEKTHTQVTYRDTTSMEIKSKDHHKTNPGFSEAGIKTSTDNTSSPIIFTFKISIVCF